jgi:hypothetical protein
MLAKVTPVYVKAPDWVKPWLRKMVDRKMKRTAQALYAALIPITFSTIGKEAVRITLASTRAALQNTRRGRLARRRNRGRATRSRSADSIGVANTGALSPSLAADEVANSTCAGTETPESVPVSLRRQ